MGWETKGHCAAAGTASWGGKGSRGRAPPLLCPCFLCSSRGFGGHFLDAAAPGIARSEQAVGRSPMTNPKGVSLFLLFFLCVCVYVAVPRILRPLLFSPKPVLGERFVNWNNLI